uniref:Uncharacterized protein n=1 Tax=viral metagenome TaxID=1070528 RepID=A0A6H1ZJA5_9ZZZZ
MNQGKDILQKLLDIEMGRLEVAVRIEKKRNIVFPETTIIIRDIQKLQGAIEKTQAGTPVPPGGDGDEGAVSMEDF